MQTDLINDVEEKNLRSTNYQKEIIAGHNGPYNDPETPLRNYGHWMTVCLYLWKETKQKKYLNRANELLEFILDKSYRPYGYSFYHRNSSGKDRCNGLIGQAWTIESLAEFWKSTGGTKPLQLAKVVFFQHKFDEITGLWHALEIDGKNLPVDPTFNHQLWFATAASLLDDTEIDSRVKLFMEKLDENLSVSDSGLILHPVISVWTKQVIHNQSSLSRAFWAISSRRPAITAKIMHKSVGYHAFNLYAFALLHRRFPEHNFWSSLKFATALSYCLSDQFKTDLNENIYGFPYNPPGFEMPLILREFSGYSKTRIAKESDYWLQCQLNLTYDPEAKLFSRNNPDPATLTARIYELTR